MWWIFGVAALIGVDQVVRVFRSGEKSLPLCFRHVLVVCGNLLLLLGVLFLFRSGAPQRYVDRHLRFGRQPPAKAAAPTSGSSGAAPARSSSSDAVGAAFKARRSNVQVQGAGNVIRVLSDDNVGSRHQRFILQLTSGQTVLVAHNIDLAPRIPGLRTGETVSFYGEYEWNAKGGVVHWTHHDPGGRHVGGWLQCRGKRFQ
jgi:hypothetical protein